jgi:hypothetical protein
VVGASVGLDRRSRGTTTIPRRNGDPNPPSSSWRICWTWSLEKTSRTSPA